MKFDDRVESFFKDVIPSKKVSNLDIMNEDEEVKRPSRDVVMTTSEIWKLGNQISNGHGFWGSHNLLSSDNPKKMVEAWIRALREKGFSDLEIIAYGDWGSARHLADMISETTTPEEFEAEVKKDGTKASDVKRQIIEGRDNGDPNILKVLKYFEATDIKTGLEE